MVGSNAGAGQRTGVTTAGSDQFPLDHYLQLVMHRKWLIVGVWLLVSLATVVVSFRLPDVFTSETLILVDPQKVPEAYVKATVTGDVRNRLGTLSQQILSQTRLQTIIETLHLYPEERKKGLPREDIITKMRSDISVRVVSDFGGAQDLQAFRISYSGPEPRLVAQVTNQIAQSFIDRNLEAREQQASGTTEFLTNQLEVARKNLEEQEAKLRDFKLKHIGEMPKQEPADLQILSQAQSQLQIEADALSRAEQQKSYLQSLMAQSAPVVDLDEGEQKGPGAKAEGPHPVKPSALAQARAQLAELLSRYGEQHPDVKRLKALIEEQEAKEAKTAPIATASAPTTDNTPPAKPATRSVVRHINPILQSQLTAIEAEIGKHQLEQQRLAKVAAAYRSKLEAIPLREQEITELERDYEMSRVYYAKLREQQLSAQTATQMEFRQKGEQFKVLDPALPAEKPSQPNRWLINSVGSLAGLVLGLLLAVAKDLFSMSIISFEDMATAGGLAVLGVVPIIQTQADLKVRKRWMLLAATSVVVVVLICCTVVMFHYNGQM